MNFQAVLDQHLRAIQERDLTALAETLPTKELLLISSNGQLFDRTQEFLAMHREWFQSSTWSLAIHPVVVHESPELAIAVLKLDYHDSPAGGSETHELSYLTLAFARREGRWQMVLDQNTPCRVLQS